MTVDLPTYGGCDWPVDPTCLTAKWDTYSDAEKARAVALASSTLHRLTGGRVGGCPVKVRPCQKSPCAAFVPFQGGPAWGPGMNTAGSWVNCGHCTSCTSGLCEVELPGPVGRVDEVRVNGSVIDASAYEVQNGRYLVYIGSDPCPFPLTQDLSLPDTAPGTFSVTYLNSYPVDHLGAIAAGTLALEFAKACGGASSKNCRLPANVVSVVRAGVSYDLQPGIFPDGFTGIDEVDVFISQWNPNGLRQDSKIWSPGLDEARITTASGSGIPPLPDDHILDGGQV